MSENENKASVETVGEKAPVTRNSIRQKVFASRGLKTRTIDFFGANIEIRQPKLGDILAAQEAEDREGAIIDTLIKYAYVPGTDEMCFEPGDAESFKQMGFDSNFLRVSNALEDLTEVNFLDKNKSSQETT